MQKKVLSMILALCMLLGLFPYAVLGTAAADSTAEYTVISTADELIALMGDSARWSGNYRLGDDIDLTGKTGQARIGDNTTAFTGIFDGNGKTISGIDLTITGSTAVGFFGVIMNAEIRNLTVAGKVSATGGKNFTGGLVGVISGQATVENCVSNVTVTGVSRVGGLVGGIVLNSATSVGVPVETAACSVTIKGCVNNSSVAGTSSRIGGIVGSASIGAAAGRSITIENCTNNGAVKGTTAVGGVVGYTDPLTSDGVVTVSGCSNTATMTGTASAKTWTAGIVGYAAPKNGGVVLVTECRNDGTIKGGAQIGGIVGYAYYTGTTVSKCYNTGDVTATAADAGGILGIAFTGNVDNCINTGAVSGTESIGGIVGRTLTDSTYTACSVTCNYNAGTTVSSNSKNVAAITGCKAGTVTYTNNYYSAGDADAAGGTAVAAADVGDASKYVGFDIYTWTFTTTGPELTVFHEHVDADGDGKCDTCGFDASCTHPTTELEVITPATCITTGIGREVCTNCGNVEEVVLPIDPANHAEDALTLSMDDGKIVYTCDCGATYTETTTAVSTVYVAASGVTTLPTAAAGTSDNPFGDFDLAMQYAGLTASANGEATVVIADSITVPATYSTPAFDGMVTVTGGTLVFAGGCAFKMNGAMTFRDMAFDTAKAGSGAYIYAQNHKLVMDTGLRMVSTGAKSKLDSMEINGVKLYVLGGFLSDTTASYTLDTDVTVRSGEYWFIGGASRCAGGVMTVAGTTKVTLGTVNDTDTLKVAWLNTFSTGSEHVDEAALKGTMIVDGVVDAARYNIVSQNGGGAEYPRTVDLVLMGDINPNYGANVDVTGSASITDCAIDLYVDERVDTAVADADLFYGDSADPTIAALKLTVTKYTYAQYCVKHLSGHSDGNEDGVCDICGASMACDHPSDALEYRMITAPTCSVEGLEEVWCTACGQKVAQNTLDVDFMSHTGLHYEYNKETSQYDLVCSDCGELYADSVTATTPVVYLDGWAKTDSTGLTAEIGSDFNSGLMAEEPVETLEEAVRRLAITGGTVYFLDRYVVGAGIDLPAYEKEITFTTEEGTSTGFVVTVHGSVLSLGGPTKFENLVVNGGAASKNTVVDGYYNTFVIVGNWNDVTFGSGLGTFGNAYFVAGRQYPKTDDDTQKDVHLTFTRTTANKINSNQAAVTFFNRIYLGDRGDSNGMFKVSNKTVTADFVGGTTAVNLYAGSVSPLAASAQMENCTTTLNFYADALIQNLRNGDNNTAGTGTAYLDKLTVNLYDNARILANFVPRNVRDLTLNISGTAEGRTQGQPIQFGVIDLTPGYLASANYTGAHTLTMNYSSHSFAAGIAAPTYSSAYDVVSNIVDECVWDDGVITTPATPEKDGVMTYTCTVCGATKTKSVPFVCTDHNYIAKADGTYYCTVCDATFTELPATELTLAAAPAVIANGKAVVTLKLTAESFWGLRFKVIAPDGFTLEDAVSTLPEASEGDGTGSGLSFMRNGNAMAILGFSTNPANTSIDQDVLTLTYTVDDTVDAAAAQIIDLEIVEAIRVGEGDAADVEIDATAVGAEVGASTHTHEYTATVTKEATCGEDGVRTYTCVCGDSYTEVIPATGNHTWGDWVETKPAEPGAAGEETRTCTVCGHTETRATEPLPETYAAYIGETGYATVQAAMDAANVLDTVTVVKGTVETVTPSKTVYLAGDFDGVTISGDYTLDVTGRYALVDGEVVTDSTIEYVPLAVKAIVRPTTTGTIAKPNLSTNLGLGSSIEYKFNSKITYVEGFADFYVKLELLGLDGKSVDEGSTDDTARTLIITDHVVQGDAERYTYVFDGIPAKCMNNTIRYTAYAVREDGSVETLVYNWGAYVYLQKQLPAATGELKDLLVALINYGALAQQYRDYNTENLISDLLDEADRRLSTEDFAELEMTKIVNGTPRTNDGDLFKSFASSLQLYDKIKVIASVSAKNTSVTEYSNVSAVYSYPDSISGETITKVVPFEKWSYNATSKKYEINMDDISAKDLRQLISFNIYADYGTDVQTSVYAIENLTFNSAENYCATQRTSSDVNLAALCCGIIHYSDMAKAYLGAK